MVADDKALNGRRMWVGAAPTPDPERIAAIGQNLPQADPATFGEQARAEVLDTVERLLSQCRNSDLSECADLVRHTRARLEALDPSHLEPRRGLAGLFDGRGGRLKRFRIEFQDAQRSLMEAGGDLAQRAERVTRRGGDLDTLHAALQRLITELDAYIVAGMAYLAELPREVLTPDNQTAADTEPTISRADTLSARLAALVGARNTAVRQLPLARLLQNGEHRTPTLIGGVGNAITAWREEWVQALGLQGKRPKRVRPDPIGMSRTRDTLLAGLAAAEAGLDASRARCNEAGVRMERVVEAVRRPT